MDMLVLAPPPALRGHVRALWELSGNLSGRYAGLPKPYVELIVSLSGLHLWSADPDSTAKVYTSGWVTPLQSAPRYAQTLGKLHLVGARLHPAAASALFGTRLPADTAPIPLQHLLGPRADWLRSALFDASAGSQRLALFAAFLETRLGRRPPLQLPSAATLAELRWRSDALADWSGLSPRGLRKSFADKLGTSPKLWMQLSRFDALLRTGPSHGALADTAAALGYTDQAHMTTEFRRFTGVSPLAYHGRRVAAGAPTDAPHLLPARQGSADFCKTALINSS